MMTLSDTSVYPTGILLDSAALCGHWLYRVPSWCWRKPFDWPEDRNWWESERLR